MGFCALCWVVLSGGDGEREVAEAVKRSDGRGRERRKEGAGEQEEGEGSKTSGRRERDDGG